MRGWAAKAEGCAWGDSTMSISGFISCMGHTHIVRFYTRSAVETLRSSDQIGSTERVRSIGSTATGANPRATTEYPVAAIHPPSPSFFLPAIHPLSLSLSLAFPPPREPHSRYIFTEMQIALVRRAPRFRIISSRLMRIKVLPLKEEDFRIYREGARAVWTGYTF